MLSNKLLSTARNFNKKTAMKRKYVWFLVIQWIFLYGSKRFLREHLLDLNTYSFKIY